MNKKKILASHLLLSGSLIISSGLSAGAEPKTTATTANSNNQKTTATAANSTNQKTTATAANSTNQQTMTTITTTTTELSPAETSAITTKSETSATDPNYPLNVPATSRTEAIMKARIGAGRVNPFAQPAGAMKPFLESSELKQAKALPKVHLPPPPKFATLAPPPPPTETIMPGIAAQSVGQAGQAMDDEMPEPPEKPLIAEKMKLVGVLADKAFFTFTDPSLRRQNKFPSTVVLANGEQFESVHLVSVDPNSVVLEEDGERITKELERIR